MSESFWLELSSARYQPNTGWNCSALTLPGAVLETILVGGTPTPESNFVIGDGRIRFLAPPASIPDVALKVSLRKRLVTIDTTIVVAVIGLVGTVLTAVLTRAATASTAKPIAKPRMCVLRPTRITGLANPDQVAIRIQLGDASIPTRHLWVKASEIGGSADAEVPCDADLIVYTVDGNAATSQVDSELTVHQEVLFTSIGKDRQFDMKRLGILHYDVFLDARVRDGD